MPEMNLDPPLQLQHSALPVAKLLALAVREARTELGWTQAELALATRATGASVSTRTVCNLELAKSDVRLSSVEAIAAALGTTTTGLLLQAEVSARRNQK